MVLTIHDQQVGFDHRVRSNRDRDAAVSRDWWERLGCLGSSQHRDEFGVGGGQRIFGGGDPDVDLVERRAHGGVDEGHALGRRCWGARLCLGEESRDDGVGREFRIIVEYERGRHRVGVEREVALDCSGRQPQGEVDRRDLLAALLGHGPPLESDQWRGAQPALAHHRQERLSNFDPARLIHRPVPRTIDHHRRLRRDELRLHRLDSRTSGHHSVLLLQGDHPVHRCC